MAVRWCEWFALCDRPADFVVWHPALGLVGCCARCAQQAGVEAERLVPVDKIGGE